MTPLSRSDSGPLASELATHGRASSRTRRLFAALLRHLLLLGTSVLLLLPFYWMLISSLKAKTAIFAQPIQWWPDPVYWDNYLRTLTYPGFPFFRFFTNSLYYACSVTLGTLIMSALVGYGFARLRFPGRRALFIATLATLMLPSIVTFIPTYVMFKQLGLLGGYAPLILLGLRFSPFFIFMMRQFFMGISYELSDAARVDGAGEWRIFWQIILPLVRPALIVVAVFTFLWTWHEFFIPLVYLSDRSQFPLSLGVFAFKNQRTIEWDLMMAASVLATLPLVLIFVAAQRYFLQGVSMTGIKG
jgi:multiple sugar transport system permease protein